MAIYHIKINQINVTQSIKIFLLQLKYFLHVLFISMVRSCLCNSFSGKYIIYLANTDDIFSGIFQIIQHRLFGRHKRKVMSTVCSFEVRILSYKWSCNDSCYCMSAHQNFSCYFAIFIQGFYRHNIFMSCNLEHTVSGCIYDQRTCFHMLTPIILDNFCSGIWFITQHFPSCLLSEFIQHILRESVRIYRKWFRRYHTCHLPMPDGRIFSHRFFMKSSVTSNWT